MSRLVIWHGQKGEDPMRGNIAILKFLRFVVIGTVLTTVLLGGIGYLLSGREGLINMGLWGIALGLLGSFSGGLAMLVETHFWTGYAERFGKHWFKKVSEEEDNKPDY
jgi:hypothetical protein